MVEGFDFVAHSRIKRSENASCENRRFMSRRHTAATQRPFGNPADIEFVGEFQSQLFVQRRRIVRKLVFILTALAFTMSLGAAQASAGAGNGISNFFHFEWLRDADGDGIPNCLDDDWERPQNGTGYGVKNGDCLLSSGAAITGDDGKMTRTRNEHRHGDGNPDGQHDRDRDRDCTNQ
jgi:hypothetical protein